MQSGERRAEPVAVLTWPEQREQAESADQSEERNLVAGALENDIGGAIAGLHPDTGVTLGVGKASPIPDFELGNPGEQLLLNKGRVHDRKNDPFPDETQNWIHAEDKVRCRRRSAQDGTRHWLPFLLVGVE